MDYGTSAGSLTLRRGDPALVTRRTRCSSPGSSPDTTYHFRVTSVDAATNTAISPNSPAAPATFTTPAAVATDTTVADFSAGTTGASTYVSDTAGGEVILAPTVGAEFAGRVCPAAGRWLHGPAGPLRSGGGLHGRRRLRPHDEPVDPGHVAGVPRTFGDTTFQNAGLAFDFNNVARWAAFGIGQHDPGSSTPVSRRASEEVIGLGAGYLGSPHTYRIEWTATRFASSSTAARSTPRPSRSPVRCGRSSATTTPVARRLSVDWMRMTPYASPGTFLSRIHSAGSTGCRLGRPVVRRGRAVGHDAGLRGPHRRDADPGRLLVLFAPIAQGGDVATLRPLPAVPRHGYLHDRRRDTDAGVRDAAVHGRARHHPPGITGRSPAPGATDVPVGTNVTVTFDEPINPATITAATVTLRAAGRGSDVPATVSYNGPDGDPRSDGRPGQRDHLHRDRRGVGRRRRRQPARRRRHVDLHHRRRADVRLPVLHLAADPRRRAARR